MMTCYIPFPYLLPVRISGWRCTIGDLSPSWKSLYLTHTSSSTCAFSSLPFVVSWLVIDIRAPDLQAWWILWREIGYEMGIKDIPRTYPSIQTWSHQYESRAMIPSPASHDLAETTT